MPRLSFIRLPVGHACLSHDRDGLTLIDAGLPGSAPMIAQAIRQAGYRPADLRRLVLTHFHADHAGGAGASLAVPWRPGCASLGNTRNQLPIVVIKIAREPPIGAASGVSTLSR